jgi:tetratricopeptide (TPR) repeat protein
LAEAYRLNPSDRTNAFDLAVAYLQTGNLSAARQQVLALLKGSDNAEFHSLFAEVEDKAGNFAGSAQEYQRAAQIEPSEQNIFDWGTELLSQHSIVAALEVFKSGIGRYPKSPAMWIGRGIALYLRGDYDEAVRSLTQATDLNPTAYRPYVFLADASNASQKESVAVAERLKRFAELYPQDARAVFYHAMSLWRGSGAREGQEEVETLLKRSSALDPKFPDAHLQLGILYASQDKYPEAIEQYRLAIALDPESAAAHYKLGQALARTGHHEQAEQEFKLYEHLHQPGAAREKDQGKDQQLINLVKEGTSSTP